MNSYNVLNNSNYNYTIDEFENIDKLFEIMNNFNFTEDEIDSIFYKIKIILEFLNIADIDELINKINEFSNILKIINLDSEVLLQSLTTKTLKMGSEIIIKKLEINDVLINIKSFCEDLYENNFNQLINKINLSLGDEGKTYISILDIFGFEIFENNGYEQLCINYTNEILQQIYNQYIFENEQIEY